MLLLLKKNGQKNEGEQALAWHPNFRIVEQLPDTKTVRTKFFVNIVAVAIALAFLLFISLREFRIHALNVQLSDLEAQVSDVTKQSSVSVGVFKLFQAEEKLFKEAHALVENPFSFADFMIRLGEVLPPEINITRVDYKGSTSGVGLSASAKGLDADASDLVSSFVQKVQADNVLSRDFSAVKLTGIARNVADGRLNFELSMSPGVGVKSDPKASAKKGEAK